MRCYDPLMTTVFIENGAYMPGNIGDDAMLKSIVRRVREELPDSEIFIPTLDWDLQERIEGVTPVLFRSKESHSRPSLLVREYKMRLRPGRILYFLPRFMFTRHMRLFCEAFEKSDIVIAGGGGYVCESFSLHARNALHVILQAKKQGKKVGMVGQGIGPIENKKVRKLVRRAAQSVDLFSLRTETYKSGIEDLPLEVMGDDALELIDLDSPPDYQDRPFIGLNLRNVSYANFDAEAMQGFTHALAKWVESRGVALQPLPVATEGGLDMGSIERSLGEMFNLTDGSRKVDSAESLMSAVETCRFTVTMSYHSAVFSLARGVPVIGLSRSEYYAGKFTGLMKIYGPEMVRIVNPETVVDAAELFDKTSAVSVQERVRSIELSRKMRDRQRDTFRKFLKEEK